MELTTKICTKCGKEKVLGEFYREPSHKNGLQPWCKICMNRATKKRYNTPEGKKIVWERDLKNLYGITFDEYNAIFEKQNGGCKICGKKLLNGRQLDTDHDHKTGEVRGLLCSKCNRGLGCFEDNPNLLEAGAMYLKGGADSVR